MEQDTVETKVNINLIKSKNEIHFNGSINDDSMSLLIEKILELESDILKKQKSLKRKCDEISKDDEFENYTIQINTPIIKLYITSYGGYVHQVFSAIDTIQNTSIPVHTICKGVSASAGTLLSMAGKKRFITENTYMLIHEIRTGHFGKYTHLVESMQNNEQLMEHIKKYYLQKTNMNLLELEEQLKKDIYWNADKCLEKGLVHEIIKANP
jgi:ATP-dependent protease ClpP protease subunit